MKKIIPLLVIIIVSSKTFSQSATDSAYTTLITSPNWMASGKSLLLSIIRIDKSMKNPPVAKSFILALDTRKLEPLNFTGNNACPSPADPKIILYTKQNPTKKADIYLYNMATAQESPLIVDTFHKFAPMFSPDGKKIVYNRESNGRGRFATLDICVYDMTTQQSKKITESGKYKSYNPVWSPDGEKIVYYFEKGDSHDQIWLTDATGSFHTNLTNDSTTHNFYPSWIDRNTIVYTLAPDNIFTMKIDGSNRQKIYDIHSFMIKYDPVTKQAVYVTQQPDSKLMLYDWQKQTSTVLLDQDSLKGLF